MAINNEKKTTTTTTVKTVKGKIPPITPMKSAEFYAEQANQNNANTANNAKKSTKNATPNNQQSKQLLKRLGIAGAVIAVLLAVLALVDNSDKPEKTGETLPPLSSPLVIPDVPNIAENNQTNQTQNVSQNSDLQNIIPAEDIEKVINADNSENIEQVIANNEKVEKAEKPKNFSQNLVENNQNSVPTSQPQIADSFGTFGEPVIQNQPTTATNANKMQQGGHTILKLNQQPQNQQNQQIQQNQQTQIKQIQKNNNEKSLSDKSATNRKLEEMLVNSQNFANDETSAPPMLGTDKIAPALPERNNLPNTRIVSTQSQIQITSAEKSIIPNDRYRIQAGVFDGKVNPQSAETLYQKLASAGIPVVLENRVQVGPFTNKEQAEKARKKLKELGINNAVIVMPKN